MKIKNIKLIISLVFFILLFGTSIYFWQQSILREQKNISEKKEAGLKNQIDYLQSQIDEMTARQQKGNNNLTGATSERYIKIIQPNGGEDLCFDENYIIKWESKGVGAVKIGFENINGDLHTFYHIGTFPATSNEEGIVGKGDITWKVGEFSVGGLTINELKKAEGIGFYYKFWITSADDGVSVDDYSDGSFTLSICQG
jgi:hypothetical protein